jgi:hypothetical protein
MKKKNIERFIKQEKIPTLKVGQVFLHLWGEDPFFSE